METLDHLVRQAMRDADDDVDIAAGRLAHRLHSDKDLYKAYAVPMIHDDCKVRCAHILRLMRGQICAGGMSPPSPALLKGMVEDTWKKRCSFLEEPEYFRPDALDYALPYYSSETITEAWEHASRQLAFGGMVCEAEVGYG